MRKSMLATILLATCILFPLQAFSTPLTNVALNKEVTLNGTFFTGGWGSGLTVGADTVVDGTFFPKDTQWDQGAVWWDSTQTGGQSIVIDLEGVFTISSFIVQADDNDAYELYYRNGSADAWHLIWYIPPYYAYGMQTRPNPYDDLEQYFLSSSIIATELMISGSSPSDLLYSVSEIQAFGAPVPEPSTMFLLGAGLAGLGFFGRRRMKK